MLEKQSRFTRWSNKVWRAHVQRDPPIGVTRGPDEGRLGAVCRIAAIALGACLLHVSVANADARTEARRAFRHGMELIQNGEYQAGIADLLRAYDTLPHPNVLYNIAVAYLYKGDLEYAERYLTRYLAEANPSEGAEAEELLRTVRERLGQQRAASADAEAPAPPAAPPPKEQEDAVSSIRKAADEIARIGTAAGSAHLQERAGRLREVADEIEKKSGEQTPSTPAAPPTPDETRAGVVAGEAPAQNSTDLARGAEGSNQVAYEEEVVSASRFAESPVDAPNATAIVTAQDIRLTGLTNIGELIRRVAGTEVTMVAPNHDEISIRGLNRRTSNKVLVLIDGRPLRQDFLGTTYIDFLPIAVEDVERIEVIRGPASALYGADAFSGVINIITRAPGKGDSFVAGSMGNHGQRRAVAGFTGKTGKLGYRVGAGFIEAYNAVTIAGDDRVDVKSLTDFPNMSTSRAWVNGELRYAGRRSEVVLGGGLVEGDHIVQGLSRLGQVSLQDSAQSQVYGSFTSATGFKLSTFWNRFDGSAGGSVSAPGGIDLASNDAIQDVIDTTLEWNGEGDWLLPQRLTIGGGYRHKDIHDWTWLDGDHTQEHFALYLQDVIQATENLKFQLSARMDRHPLLSSLQFSPRGSIVYRVAQAQSVRLTAGRAFRGPSFMESYLQVENPTPIRAVSAWGVGNTNLKPESITSYEIGYTNQASDFFALETNVYYNLVKDAILFTDIDPFTLSDFADPNNDLAKFDPAVSAFPISTLRFENESATYRQLGAEFGVRVFPVDRVDLYTNYAIHDTRPTDKAQVDAVRAKEQQTSQHKVNAGVQYRSRFGLDTSIDLHWMSKQVWVEQVTDLTRGVVFATFDQPAFVLLNGRLGYRLLGDRLELGLVGTNLVNSNKRQHPFGQPVDTRVLGTAKLRF